MTDIIKKLEVFSNKNTLRFITCGSVDDGKSTLIGRLLYDSKLILDDQLDSLKNDTKKHSNTDENEEFDFSLLVDGLQAEREQGITIDVAYRFFATDKRKFIVADTPGHIQYTRNMATGSSTADLAILLVDARQGILEQTKRHSFITTLLGVKNLIVAVNKMDLVDYKQDIFEKIKNDYINFAKNIENFQDLSIDFIPMSALKGDNVTTKSTNTEWYNGDSLVSILENVEINYSNNQDFIYAVQYVSRPNLDFRGFKGKVISGEIGNDEEVQIFGKKTYTKIKDVGNESKRIQSSDVSCVTLHDEVDVSSGDFITRSSTSLRMSNRFNADLIWMDSASMSCEKEYIVKFYNNQSQTKNININFLYDINSLDKVENDKDKIKLNEIANIDIVTNNNIPLMQYKTNKQLGSFILIDKFTNATCGAGVIRKNIIDDIKNPVSKNITAHKVDITNNLRAEQKNQKPICIWLTGLSGSGKSTIATILDKKLYTLKKHSFVLDGDNVRFGLNENLGFSTEDRYENIRRIGHTSKLMYDSGLIVISALISPDAKIRNIVKDQIFKDCNFFEIYLNASIEDCEKRDPKELYKKAKDGKIKNFTGINSPYDIPNNPDLVVDTVGISPEESADKILDLLNKKNLL